MVIKLKAFSHRRFKVCRHQNRKISTDPCQALRMKFTLDGWTECQTLELKDGGCVGKVGVPGGGSCIHMTTAFGKLCMLFKKPTFLLIRRSRVRAQVVEPNKKTAAFMAVFF